MLERCVELFAPAVTAREGAAAPSGAASKVSAASAVDGSAKNGTGAPGPVIVDATLGLGGHSEALLERFENLTVIGLDRDTSAIALAKQRLAPFGERFKAVHTVYDGIAKAVADCGFKQIDGVLFDLGVSSMQLDLAERGFAYAKDAPLDMRMDQQAGTTAAELLNTLSETELKQLFQRYGDEPLAARYAAAIVAARGADPLTRSQQLVDILQHATPAKIKAQRHPAKRVFQALRVAVNDEMAVLARAIPSAMQLLRVGGRIVVMSYQSQEDRFVKKTLSAAAASQSPQGLPVELPEFAPRFELLTRGAEQADETERNLNPRSIPVRLRAAQRVRPA